QFPRAATSPRETPYKCPASTPRPRAHTACRSQFESHPALHRTESQTPPARKFLPERSARCFPRHRKLLARGSSPFLFVSAFRRQSPSLLPFSRFPDRSSLGRTAPC